jgi:hypothetical protein
MCDTHADTAESDTMNNQHNARQRISAQANYGTGPVQFANKAALAAMAALIRVSDKTPDQVADDAWQFALALVRRRPKPFMPELHTDASEA